MNNIMLKSTGVAAGIFSGSGMINGWSIALFNVPLTVLGMAAAGSMLSFAYTSDTDDKITKRKLYTLAISNTILATAAVAVLPGWLGWDWANSKIEGSLALLLSASARFFIPALIRLPSELFQKWFKLGKYNQGGADTSLEYKGNEQINYEESDPDAKTVRTRTKTKKGYQNDR